MRPGERDELPPRPAYRGHRQHVPLRGGIRLLKLSRRRFLGGVTGAWLVRASRHIAVLLTTGLALAALLRWIAAITVHRRQGLDLLAEPGGIDVG